MEGFIETNGELDIEWDWERDYSLEFSGGVVALMQGDTEIALELDQQTMMGETPQLFAGHLDLFETSDVGQKYLDYVNAQFGVQLAEAIAGYASAEVYYSGGGVLLVDSSNNVLARGDLHIELEPNEWGHANFGLNFEGGPNGHPLIGFTAYSTVADNGKLDFAQYGVSLREYLYKSEMSPEEWAAVKAEYGPTDDLPIAGWDTEVELVELQTRYRDGNADPADGALDPSFQGYHARFIEGYVDEYDNDRLELFWDWDNDDRIEIEGSLETHYVGNEVIATATGRNFEITDVTDLSTNLSLGLLT